jgi:hypothetical protein
MSVIDIRDETVNEIVVTDVICLKAEQRTFPYEKGLSIAGHGTAKVVLIGKRQVEDMIKALQKAIELGWLDTEEYQNMSEQEGQ